MNSRMVATTVAAPIFSSSFIVLAKAVEWIAERVADGMHGRPHSGLHANPGRRLIRMGGASLDRNDPSTALSSTRPFVIRELRQGAHHPDS